MPEFFSTIPGGDALKSAYSIARALFIAVDVVLAGLFLYVFPKTLNYRPHLDLRKIPKRKTQPVVLRNMYFRDHWQRLLKKYTEAPTPDSMRLAIIEADALVDHLLRDLNFPGDHLADRLSYLNNQDIASLDGVWDAHRLRNDIVHRPAGGVGIKEGMAALKKYEAFFKELKIL